MSAGSMALAVAAVGGLGILALVGVSAYIDHQRAKQSTPVEAEAES